jgi:predicted SAM-dependent methyltransferase
MIAKLSSRAIGLIARGFAVLGSAKLCYACNRRIGRFLPYRGGWKNVPPLIRALDVIGSDVENFSCPRCGAHDRERHLLMYFDRAGMWKRIEGAGVLHFAPERTLAARIAKARPARYVKADLFPAAADTTREDISRLSFADRSFGVVIANHVLEHVADDRAAMKEIFRVLEPGGLAVLQTPYSDKLATTFEDESIRDGEARLLAYGQEDHVRLYGRDLFSRLQSAGFVSKVLEHDTALKDYGETLYGVNRREPFICMERPGVQG